MPISELELSSLKALGDKLKNVLVEIISGFPNHAQTIYGMSEHLNYNRSNCQRLLKAVHKNSSGIEVLCLLPGISGLTEFVVKIEASASKKTLVHVSKTIKEFEQKIKQLARSHADFKRQLSFVNGEAKENIDQPEATKRKVFFNAASKLLGSSVESLFSGHILTENTHNNEYLQEIAMISKFGIKRKANTAPCVLFYTHPHPVDFTKPETITASSRVETKDFHIGIVDEYSTPGVMEAYVDFSPSNLGLVFNDVPNVDAFDATFLLSNPDELSNPLREKSKCSSTFISIKSPTKKLTMMVFLERKIDMRSTVNIGCYQSSQNIKDKAHRDNDSWTDHLPGFAELKIVNLDAPRHDSNIDESIRDLSDYMFNFTQLDKKDFVCYMMEVDYPIWSSTYRIYFDHC